jgi:hypothetical protein
MKRSSSKTTSEEDQKPDIIPSKKVQKSPQEVSPTKIKPENGEWDPEKRAVFMDLIIAAGYKAINLDEVASTVSTNAECADEQLGMGKKQLVNQLTPGRKGSFREKAVQAVKGG